MQSLKKDTEQKTKTKLVQAEAQLAPSEVNKVSKKRKVKQITGGRHIS